MVQPKTRNKIIDVTLSLAAERPWAEVTPERIAERAGVTLSGLRAAYDGRLDILADFVRRIDEAVLAGRDADMKEEAPRERLFDVLFSRLEALAPYKPAIRRLGKAARRDPMLALELNGIVTRSMGWMLNGAGIPATGGAGLISAQGLALIWARVMRVWLRDDDPGLARTMAALDTQLRRAERNFLRLKRVGRLLRRCRRLRRDIQESRSVDERDLAEGHPS